MPLYALSLIFISSLSKPTKPATVNRELTTFKTIFNKAVRNGKAERNPAQGVKPFKENNARDRILSSAEYVLLLAHCPAHIKPVVKLAYFNAMRRGEILNLKWERVDLKDGFIRLRPEDTKTMSVFKRYNPVSKDELKALVGEKI